MVDPLTFPLSLCWITMRDDVIAIGAAPAGSAPPGMKMRIAVAAAFIAIFVYTPQTVNGQEETHRLQGIFFGGSGGIGGARIDHPEGTTGLKGGGVAALTFGWVFRRWAIGGELTSWGTSILGTPVHLHTFGPDWSLRRTASWDPSSEEPSVLP